MEGVITNLFGISWYEYASSSVQDQMIESTKVFFGLFYLGCAVICLLINEKRKWAGWIMIVSSVLLTFLALLYCKEKFFHVGQFFEYSIQLVSPTLLYYLVFDRISKRKTVLLASIATALTFTCHGLYALGFYPQPGHFVDMTIRGFLVNEEVARLMLKVFGALDIVISIGIFIPNMARICWIYAVLWGLATALARVWTNFYWDFPLESLNQWIPEMLYRIPHGTIPILVLMITIEGSCFAIVSRFLGSLYRSPKI